jgi:molybdate transport system substrate-binding protein
VAKNEADLGIVYRTDAMVEPKVKVIYAIPSSLHSKIIYSVSLLGMKPNLEATNFYQYLFSDEARKIFSEAGFKELNP